MAVGGIVAIPFILKSMDKNIKPGNTCLTCKRILSPSDERSVYTVYWRDIPINKWVCKNCAQKGLDLQGGVCPFCKKPLKWSDSMMPRLDKWYHSQCAYIMDRGGSVINVDPSKEVVVKIRCPYCNHTYDETLDKCSNCGAGHT